VASFTFTDEGERRRAREALDAAVYEALEAVERAYHGDPTARPPELTVMLAAWSTFVLGVWTGQLGFAALRVLDRRPGRA
jgi:hypothetical protein